MQVNLPFHVVDIAADELRTLSGERVDLRETIRYLEIRLSEKDEIIAKVWDDVSVTDDSLTQCITDIRKAIGDEERRVLRTVSRKGYVLVPAHRSASWAGHVPDKPSLAVMPFLSTGGQNDATLGAGVAMEIINELARNRDLRLIARDSSFALAARNLMSQELGERLGTRYLVEGTAERSGNKLLVDVQLVDAVDGTILSKGSDQRVVGIEGAVTTTMKDGQPNTTVKGNWTIVGGKGSLAGQKGEGSYSGYFTSPDKFHVDWGGMVSSSKEAKVD